MNHSEIEASIIKAKNGNREELLRIIEQYKPFIIKTAKQFYIKEAPSSLSLGNLIPADLGLALIRPSIMMQMTLPSL